MDLSPQEQVRKILGHHYQTFETFFRESMTEARALLGPVLHIVEKRTIRSLVRDVVVAKIKGHFRHMPGVRFTEQNGLFLLHVAGEYSLRFKKLDDNNHASGIETKQVKLFIGQLEIEGITASTTHLDVGYKLNATETAIESVIISCPNGKKTDWFIDLTGELTDVAASIVLLPTAKPARTATKVKVKNAVKSIEKTS